MSPSDPAVEEKIGKFIRLIRTLRVRSEPARGHGAEQHIARYVAQAFVNHTFAGTVRDDQRFISDKPGFDLFHSVLHEVRMKWGQRDVP
ncbi:MAG: hypothetical protein PUK52_09615, partial [Desulfovibrio sp.]|nr:hypothetical protein [Desulfovibrio sp.]